MNGEDWTDRPLLIIATGPSLAGFDFSRLKGLGRILAVKAVWRDLPFADACFGLDVQWIRREHETLAALAQRMPLYLAVGEDEQARSPHITGAHYLRKVRHAGLSDNPREIQSGGNSGFGAFNLAYHKRPPLIVLFGFDYSPDGDHYCNDRYAHNEPGHNARYYPRWAAEYDLAREQIAKAGIDVLNASPRSTVTAFRKCSPDDAIADLTTAAIHIYRLRFPAVRSDSVCGRTAEHP